MQTLRHLRLAAGRRAAHASAPTLGNDLVSYLRHPSRDQEVYLVRTSAADERGTQGFACSASEHLHRGTNVMGVA
jgi:hypothetical protein